MDIKPGRMVYLGYGKYWRSDAIVGLRPIEGDDRGPGHRTEVHTATLDDPIVASRSESAILRDMAFAGEEQFRMREAREIMGDLLDALEDVPDVLRRMLATEAHFDVHSWTRRVKTLIKVESEAGENQPELFE